MYQYQNRLKNTKLFHIQNFLSALDFADYMNIFYFFQDTFASSNCNHTDPSFNLFIKNIIYYQICQEVWALRPIYGI